MIELRKDGQLIYRDENGSKVPVTVKRCFPWADPLSFFSLRDSEDREVKLIASLEELKTDAREALLQALQEEGFCFKIVSIESIVEEFELRVWSVTTEQGERRFQTRLQDWPQTLADGGIVIRDLSGDVYLISEPHQLCSRSQKLLWAFME